MLEWINKQGVKSTKGYVFQSAHRFYYHYVEDDHVLKVFVEGVFDADENYTLQINDNFNEKWEAPYSDEMLSDEKLKEVRQNICEALDFMKIDYKFVKM